MARPGRARGATTLAALLAACIAVLVPGAPARAEDGPTFTVTTTTDDDGSSFVICARGDGPCTLRGAVRAANAAPVRATIAVPAGDAPYALTDPAGPLLIAADVAIVGGGADRTIVDGRRVGRVLDIAADSVDISDITILDGYAADGEGGAGIRYRGGPGGVLRARRAAIRGNLAVCACRGGGLFVRDGAGAVELIDVTFEGNRVAGPGPEGGAGGAGGGLAVGATAGGGPGLIMTNVALTGNAAGIGGGLVTARPGALSGVAFHGNQGGAALAVGVALTTAGVTVDGVPVARVDGAPVARGGEGAGAPAAGGSTVTGGPGNVLAVSGRTAGGGADPAALGRGVGAASVAGPGPADLARTPELSSLALFGTGAAGIAGYGWVRLRAARNRRRRD